MFRERVGLCAQRRGLELSSSQAEAAPAKFIRKRRQFNLLPMLESRNRSTCIDESSRREHTYSLVERIN